MLLERRTAGGLAWALTIIELSRSGHTTMAGNFSNVINTDAKFIGNAEWRLHLSRGANAKCKRHMAYPSSNGAGADNAGDRRYQ